MNYWEFLLYGVYTELRTEVAKRLLGFLWWIIEPVMYMAVFYVVFGLALRQGGPDYVPFLLSGMIAWKWFDGSVRQAGSSLSSNAGLIQQIYLPKSLLGLIQILSNTFKFLIVLALFMVFLIIIGKHPTLSWLALPLVILVQLYLVIGIGLMLGAIIPFAQDLKQVVDNLLMLLMFMSGVFFRPESTPESIRWVFDFNPVVQVIQAYRTILLDGQWPDFAGLGYVCVFATPLLVMALLVFRRFERHYPKLML
jgi:lipopolysaccharide transport system permease protein